MTRHEIDPRLVAASIAKRCAEFARQRTRQIKLTIAALERYNQDPKGWASKPDPTYISPMFDRFVARERDHYAKAHVVEYDGRFTLAYDDTGGTGPFRSLEEAVAWFVAGGR